MRRLVAVLGAAFAALVLAVPAGAGHWYWSGFLFPGSSNRDGNCIWYPSRSSCSGGNYWRFHQGAQDDQGWYVKVLVGFENQQRIRGVWVRQGESVVLNPSDVGMCCYLKAVATHWEGGGALNMHDWAVSG
jgi:hypothetical protein